MIVAFSLMTPLGVILGAFISSNSIFSSIFFSISSGTFIYIATTEIIVEEFSISK